MDEKKNGDVSTVENGIDSSTVKLAHKGDENEVRGNWGGKLEFILTCVGYAVGLGNVWRFPYLCYKNGGGAFLIPYVIMLLFVGLPLFYLELAFGQFASQGPISIWVLNPLFKGLGYCMVIVSGLIGLYYNVIIAYCLFYFFASMTDYLPWQDCDQEWNTDACSIKNSTTTNDTGFMTTLAPSMTTMMSNITANKTATPAEEYFNHFVLKITDGIEFPGGLKWDLTLCLLLAWIIVFLVLIKGIQSLGKVVYFTAIFPYLLLTALLIRGATLEGSLEGVKFYVTPNFTRLQDSTVWSDAAVQIFYSLSACSGGLIAMSSFNKFNNNVQRDALLVPFINCGTSIFAGFVIFSVLGFMAHEKGVPVSEVAAGGPGLAFVVYPEGISKMPVSPLWAILFFFMMTILGFSSEFSMMETVMAAFMDEYSSVLRSKKKYNYIFRGTICAVFFLLGLPMCARSGFYLLNLVDTFVGGFPLLFVGLFELIAVVWIYGYDKFSEDIQLMLGKKPNIFWRITWCFVSPTLLFATIIFKCIQYTPLTMGDYIYPDWAQALGWLITLFPIVFIPGWFVMKYCYDGGWRLLRDEMKPRDAWGPALEIHRLNTHYSRSTAMQTMKKEEAAYTNQAHEQEKY